MEIHGQLKRFAVETLGSDPSAAADKFTGRLWYNTADDFVKYTDETGGVHRFVAHDVAETLTNKSLSDSTTYIIDESDATKRAQFQASGITTGQTRVFTLPDFNGTLATLAGTESFSNKTLQDSTVAFADEGDATKQFKFQASGISTATTRVYTVPNFDGTLATLAGTEAFSNKTLQDSTVSFVDESDATKAFKFQASGISTATTRVYTVPNYDGTLATLAGTETLTNKSLSDSTTYIIDDGDATKRAQFQASGITAGQTRVFTLPDYNGTLATLAGTESLSNKSFSDAISLAEIASPTTPASGFIKLYAKSDNKLYFMTDAGTESQVGAGASGGSINHMSSNPDAETDTSGFSTYADAAGTSPVDGTGGAPTTTWTRTTSGPLRGTASFLLTKDAANRQGEGVGFAFTIADADKAKVHTIEFSYEVASGTYADNDLTVWIYDVTNSRLIQPTAYQIKNVGIESKHYAVFQTSSDSTSYRLIIHVGSTSASAYTVKFDDFKIAPQFVVQGTPVTDWQSYTPTFSAGWGTPTNTAFQWRRVGDTMEIRGSFTTGTVAASTARISIPSGYAFDTTKLSSLGSIAGEATTHESSTNSVRNTATVFVANGQTTNLSFSNVGDGATNQNLTEMTATSCWGNSSAVSLMAKVPISGWSSNVVMSDSADTRVVACRATLTTAQTGVADKVIPFNSATIDTHSGMNTTTGVYTVKVPGKYLIHARALFSSLDGATNVTIAIRKNSSAVNQAYGSVLTAGATSSGMLQITDLLDLVAGDTIDIYADGDASFDIDNASSRTAVVIEMLSGPAQIAASETVSCRYTTAAGQSIETGGTGETVIFGTKGWDSHGAMNASTGIFTAPISGTYRVTCFAYLASSNQWAAGEPAYLRLYKNGSIYSYLDYYTAESATSKPTPLRGSDEVQLLAGETININIANESGATIALNALATVNWVAITRVGNY